MGLNVYLLEPGNSMRKIQSRKILKSCNHALHNIKIFIDTALIFPGRIELLNTIFKLLRPTHHTSGIEPGARIEVATKMCSIHSISTKLGKAPLPTTFL